MGGLGLLAPPRALYVHVPLCRSRCAYCDFFSLAAAQYSPARLEGLIDAILARLDEAMRDNPPVGGGFDTVYIGGGTPTALPRPLLSRLLKGIASRSASIGEWTLEANPESLDAEALESALGAGVTRLSLGVQSLDDELLKALGRGARRVDCEKAFELAHSFGGLDLSADLIAGLPRRSPLAEEARHLVELGAEHLSIYDLSLEKGTRLEAMVEGGGFVLPPLDESADERSEAEAALERLGLRRYEISNFSRPGRECRHNLVYWRMDSYLGIGPGAVSTFRLRPQEGEAAGHRGSSLRVEEARDVEAYCSTRPFPRFETPIGPRDSAFETVMMGFRTIFGVDGRAFAERYGLELEAVIGKTLAAWATYLVPASAPPASGSRDLALNGRGMDILNRFLLDCLGEIESSFPAGISAS